MPRIVDLQAFEVLDSRGTPTVKGRVTLDSGHILSACVPSGASVGTREACELRDGDPARYNGKGVTKAVNNINRVIAERVVGMSCLEQQKIDQAMVDLDNTPNKSRLGANAILAVSLAAARGAAAVNDQLLYERINELADGPPKSLPIPFFNILNGGVHASASTDFQEFMVVPFGMPTFSAALRAGVEIFYALGKRLSNESLSVNVGFEGGYAPSGLSNKRALEYVTDAIESAGYTAGEQVGIALDVAATELFNSRSGRYELPSEERQLSAAELLETYEDICNNFPIISIEDGFAEDDWNAWCAMTSKLGKRIQIVGDDLFVTQECYLQEGIAKGAANAILVKLNQVGTLGETLNTMAAARSAEFGTVVSHRSGETEDTFIADLAVGTDSGQIKTGAPSRGERTAKYNRLLEIEQELGQSAMFAGKLPFERQ